MFAGTYKTPISIPIDAKEICIIVYAYHGSLGYIGTTFNLVVHELSETLITYTSGWYYSTSDCGSIAIKINKNTIQEPSTTRGGVVVQSPMITVSYR